MRIVAYMLLIAVLLAGGCAPSIGVGESFARAGYNFSTIDIVAIVTVEGAVESETAKNQIADLFAAEFLKKGYAPMERTQVKAKLNEQQFQTADLITEEGAAEAGRLLGAPAVLIINVPHFGRETSIAAKMINIEDGSILWMGRGGSKNERLLPSVFGSEDTFAREEELLGGIATGAAMAGAGGLALSPEQEDKARRIIRRMCSTLPSRLTSEW